MSLVHVLPILVFLVAGGRTTAPVTRSDEPVQPLRIALLSDTHTNRRAPYTDEAAYRGRLDTAIAQINAARVDAVLIAGDLTEDARPEEMDDFAAQVRGFAAPVRWVPGNHDVGGKKLATRPGVAVTSVRVDQFEKRLGPSWWSASIGSANRVRVIGVNASLLGSGLPEESAQWTFLEKELGRARAPRTLLLMHYPPFVSSPDEPGGDYWNIEPAPRARLIALILQPRARVVGVLSGHLHRWNDTRLGSIRMLTTPPISFGIPAGPQAEGWTLLTVTPGGGLEAEVRPLRPVNPAP